MKRFRAPLIAAAIVVGLLVLALAVVFSAGFQTWAARRALASQSDVRGAVGRVSADLGRVEIHDVRLEREGAVLTLPSADLRVRVLPALFSRKFEISGLVAKGWILDLSKWRSTAPASARSNGSVGSVGSSPQPAAGASGTATPDANATAMAFRGVFASLGLPIDLTLDRIDLAGDVVLPEARGRVKLTLTGGGIRPGREGSFSYTADAALADPKVSAVGMRGRVGLEMDTPRTVRKIGLRGDVSASGTQFPNGLALTAQASATRREAGESYSLGVITEGREVLQVAADLPAAAPLLTGTWKANLRHSDVMPFALGQPIPEFTLIGEGRFDTDPKFAEVHAAGHVNGSARQLHVLVAELSEIGAVSVTADFDLGRRGAVLSVRKLDADVATERPVARLQSLQAFELNPVTAELRAENAERPLFDVILHGVPIAWIKPFVPTVNIAGGDVRGELEAMMRAGGTKLRTKSPLTMAGASMQHGGQPLVANVDLSLAAAADYTPHGWQAEIDELKLRTGGATLLSVAAKAGQLPGADQPMKAAGRLTADLAAVFAQPAAAGMLALTGGEAVVDFAASLGAKKEIEAKVALTKLAVPAPPPAKNSAEKPAVATAEQSGENLPAISAVIRADLGADGQLTLNAPLVIERETRKSDLTIAGTLAVSKDVKTIEAQLTSEQLVVDDARMLAALLPAGKEKEETPKRDAKPVWAGFRGAIALQLKKVIYSDTFQATDVAGTLRLDEGELKFEAMRMGLGEGDARFDGAVTFDARESKPYGLFANLAVSEFDPGPLLRAMNPRQPPTVEGRFTIRSDLAARANALDGLPAGATGEIEVTSRGGVFRGLPVNVGNVVENTNKLAAWLASAGNALGALTGKKDAAEVTSKAQAVAELAKGLNPIPYDQLSVMLSRDDGLNTTLRDFILISPEIRLTGNGRATHRAGAALLDDTLSMEFRLLARGRHGELLKILGVLEPEPDNLGYSACTLPLRVGGTLGAPDTSELNNRLVAIAVEKTGAGERASEFLQKVRGAKPNGE